MQTKMSELHNITIALQTDHDNKEDASKIERKRSVVETRQEAHTSTSLGNSGLHDRCTENSATSGAEKNTSTLSPVQTSMQSNESSNDHTQASSIPRGIGMTVIKQTQRKVFQELDAWILMSQSELDIARLLTGDIEGVVTVLLIDISESMAEGLKEVRSLEGASDLKDEYIAIATFGHETGLQVYLTLEYDTIVKYIDHVRLGGPSPLYGGLWMAMAGSAAGRSFTTNGILVVPKIIVISDYRPTETLLIMGPDIPNGETIDESMADIMSILGEMNKTDKSVFFVAVGDFNKDFVQVLRSIDKKVYNYTDGRRLAKRYFLSTMAASFDFTAFRFDFRRRPDMSSEDRADMHDIRMESHWRTQMIDNSRVWVCWDVESEFLYLQNYGENGYDVLVTGEQRTLKPGEKIGVGCTVKPGRDSQNQGFHEWNTGVVIRVQPPKAHVRWDSGSRGDYSYGEDGKYEIEICTLTRDEASAMAHTPVQTRHSTRNEVKPEQSTRKNKNKNDS
ncbi:hypothetical protein DPMN_108932 [Dreissena polymorpha]|uniref:VWFA domain-containing protein n=1 Tax=Dreissena polymorpha TaxID=45954 RepID=A0A9D4K9Q3_DREPO|nr:hypothetical protein DPMN_108932 [Dreissena polymorpha]